MPNAKQHLENNVAWLEVIKEQKDKFTLFRGLVITGWQRYDHFATLAETFPAGKLSFFVEHEQLSSEKIAVLHISSRLLEQKK